VIIVSCKRITRTFLEEKYEAFMKALPARANISCVVSDKIDKFFGAVRKLG
jgi:hypothetical protein